MSKKIDLVCQYCNKEYNLPPSKAKNSRFCSKECRIDSQKKEKKEFNCRFCNKTFLTKRFDQEYCDMKCYKKDVKLERIDLECEYCGKNFIKAINRKTKYCSKDCQMSAQSSGLAEIPSNGRLGFRKDLPSNYCFKSSLEADYARYCNSIGKKWIYEHKTFTVSYDGKDKKYTPDFYHPDEDLYVETKAIRRDRKFNSNLLAADILKEQGLNIEVLLMGDFYRMIKQSGHYWTVENIENKNYLGTRHLIYLKG